MTREQSGFQAVPVALAAELAGIPWGKLPALPALYLIGRHHGQCRLLPLEIPDSDWQAAPFDHVIVNAARIGASHIAKSGTRLHSAIIGAAVRYEARDLPRLTGKGPGLTRALAGPVAGQGHPGPGRPRLRYIFAIAGDGTSWEAAQLRSQPFPALPSTAAYPRGRPSPRDISALRDFTRIIFGLEDPACER